MGGADHRDRRGVHRPRDRGRALRPGRDRPDGPPAQAVQRGVQALRARRRPRAAAGRVDPGGRAAAPSSAARRTPASTEVDAPARRPARSRSTRPRPGRTAGLPIAATTVVRGTSRRSAASVDTAATPWLVTPPSWRPDLTDPADLAEEVIRLEGYDADPVGAAAGAAPGRGLTDARSGCAAGSGGRWRTPATSRRRAYPFVGEADLDALGLPADDDRRHALRLANPLSDEEPLLRTTLLPGLLAALRRNVGRGSTDVALFEIGLVFRPGPDAAAGRAAAAGRPAADRRRDRRAGRRAARPAAARRRRARRRARAGRLVGAGPAAPLGRRRRGGPRRSRAQARRRARRCAPTSTRRGTRAAAPRCCATARSSATPASCTRGWSTALGLPARTCAMELDLDLLAAGDRPGAGAAALDVPAGDPGRRAGRRRRRAGRRGRGGAARRRGRAARVAAAVRRLPRASRSARARRRWPTRCGSGRPTGRSPSRRPPPPGTPRWPRRPGAPGRSCAVPDRRGAGRAGHRCRARDRPRGRARAGRRRRARSR